MVKMKEQNCDSSSSFTPMCAFLFLGGWSARIAFLGIYAMVGKVTRFPPPSEWFYPGAPSCLEVTPHLRLLGICLHCCYNCRLSPCFQVSRDTAPCALHPLCEPGGMLSDILRAPGMRAPRVCKQQTAVCLEGTAPWSL